MTTKLALDFHTATGAEIPHVAVDAYDAYGEVDTRVADFYIRADDGVYGVSATEARAIAFIEHEVACARAVWARPR